MIDKILEKLLTFKDFVLFLDKLIIHFFWVINFGYIFITLNAIAMYRQYPTEENLFVLATIPIQIFIMYIVMYKIFKDDFEQMK